MHLEECPVCAWGPKSGYPLLVQPEELRRGIYQLDCPRCGTFRFVESDRMERLTEIERVAVSSFVKKLHLRGLRVPLLSMKPRRPRKNATKLEDILAVAPRTFGAIQDEMLLTLAAMGTYGAGLKVFSVEYGGQLIAPIAFTFDTEKTLFQLDQLIEEGLLQPLVDRSGTESLREAMKVTGLSNVELSLTRKGWSRFEELQRGTAEKPRQAFVAMWYDESMKSAYHEGFEQAIMDAGYDPVQLAFVEHNDDIDDRIVAEIRKSRFVVADFTGGRGGVYFEAGFALGVGKPVVFTCQREWFVRHGVHFDTEHRNHILWEDLAELREKLRARIEATMPSP